MFIGKAIKSFDEAVDIFKVESKFDHNENAQVVIVKW